MRKMISVLKTLLHLILVLRFYDDINRDTSKKKKVEPFF